MNIVWNDVFALILTGMVVVFLALGFLTLVVMAIGKIATTLQKNNVSEQKANMEEPPEEAASYAAQTDELPPTVVAVISAAVAAVMEPNAAYHITKISQTHQTPSAWRTAGVVQNTRSF